jgi:hypothetical protein
MIATSSQNDTIRVMAESFATACSRPRLSAEYPIREFWSAASE